MRTRTPFAHIIIHSYLSLCLPFVLVARRLPGGPNLAEDRRRLPKVRVDGPDGPEYIRCPTGSAVLTGPSDDYGDLSVPYVIHAVGPNYWDHCREDDTREQLESGIAEADGLLASAYRTSLDLAADNGITEVAFSLLSAGVYRGPLKLEAVLEVAVEAIGDWAMTRARERGEGDAGRAPAPGTEAEKKRMEVTLCAFNERECKLLKEICDEAFGSSSGVVDAPSSTTTT